jgi:hypothetical protein
MGTDHQTAKVYFNKLSLIQFAFIGGIVILIGGFCVYLNLLSADGDSKKYSSPMFMFLVPISVIIAIAQTNYTFKTKLGSVRNETNLKAKMIGYKELVVVRSAVLSGPCFMVMAALARTNNIDYLLYVVFLVGVLIIKRPTVKLAIAELELNKDQIAVLKDPNSIVV